MLRMSEANPVDRKQFPLGTALVVTGVLTLAAIAGHTALAIHSGTKEVLATIENATPTTHALPPSTYILTRPNAVATTRDATVTASAAPFAPATTGGGVGVGGGRNL